jgi:signal transduction histidine kinase
LELTLVDVDEMLHDVEAQLQKLAADKSITLTIESGDKLPLLLVDGMLYQQAISNLVGNAVKYTQDGGQVTIRAFVDGESHLTVKVTDNGPGIRPEDQERLFEAFYRVPQREGGPPRPPGSGLGLALVKAIAETHNGNVSVESTVGEGSTFRITLPIRNPGDF